MEFHYEELHQKLAIPCPPTSYQPENTVAYRWVFDELDDERNFLPQYLKKPKRFNDKNDLTKCKAVGLSMYKDLESAIGKFLFLKENQGLQEKAFIILGTKIAQGMLTLEDGVNECKKDGTTIVTGHFTHHPAKRFNYTEKFTVIACFIK